MKCIKCKSRLIEREGKFGKFWCCPNSTIGDNHGTFKTRQMLYNKLYHDSIPPERDLDFLVRKEMMTFGIEMTELDRFIEGGIEAAEDDEDHWMNTRPY